MAYVCSLLSLRKLLFILFFVSCVIFVVYLNDNFSLAINNSRPSQSLLQMPSFLEKGNKIKLAKAEFVLIPPEKTWTYKCVNNRCVRQHYFGTGDIEKNTAESYEKRVPYMTCTMTCGPINIWPQPTLKSTLGSKAMSFRLIDIQSSVSTKFSNVEELLKDAFQVFRDEIRQLLAIHMTSIEDFSENINDRVNPVTDEMTNFNDRNDLAEFYKNDNKHYDIRHFDLDIKVTKSPETYLTLKTDERYNLTITHEKRKLSAKIMANSFVGAKHALTTLQQLIWFDDEDGVLKILTRAVIMDAPKFNYRGLMLDTSRHYFSVESIKRTIVGMSHSKLNRFHWHITDSQSFPYVSKAYPQLALYGAYSSREVYTMDDIRDIVAFAKVRGIQIIPEIDAPAHAGNGWQWGPKHNLGDLSLCINQQPWSYFCGEPPCGQLNPKNNNTYMILQKLYEELLELAGPLDYFHLGGDEVNLECWAQHFNESDLRTLWCDFMQQALNRLNVASKGAVPKMAAVWSSGLTNYPCLSRNNVAVQVWGGSKWPENQQLLNNGFNIVISHVDAWYLDCGFGSWRSTGEGACSPYRNWQLVYKHRPWDEMRLTSQQMKQVLGGEACLWTEQVDEATLDSRLWPRTAALAERLWSDPSEEMISESVQKDVYNRMSVFRSHLIELGIKAEPIFPKYCAQNQDECV